MKRLNCALATLAMVMCTYIPARAEFGGRLSSNQEFTVVITNTSATTTVVTIYYIDKRGLDVVGMMTVSGTDPVLETFPKPGRDVRRVIIQVDPSPAQQVKLTLNQSAPQTFEAGIQLVFDVE